jgi:predicted transcriptional regulator
MKDRKLKITRKADDDSKVFSVRVNTNIVDKLDEIAGKTKRSRNELINTCLQFAIENIEFEE